MNFKVPLMGFSIEVDGYLERAVEVMVEADAMFKRHLGSSQVRKKHKGNMDLMQAKGFSIEGITKNHRLHKVGSKRLLLCSMIPRFSH